MKIVFNSTYGGFRWPDEICKKFDICRYDYYGDERTNPDIIEALEAYLLTDPDCELRVADIPDDATDWMISEYDGNETIYCVINGKLYGLFEKYSDDYDVEGFYWRMLRKEEW